MKMIKEKIITFFVNNLWVLFLINIKSLWESLVWIFEPLQALIQKQNTLQMTTSFPLGYNEIMLLIVSVILYSVCKFLINGINGISSEITDNLNDLSRILNTKIKYVDFRIENNGLDNDAYIKKLHSEGFSKEDLEEIGVNDAFLKQNKVKLLP